jgi:hypothetical protein
MDGNHRKPRKISDSRGEFPYADPRAPFILIAGTEIDAEGDGMNWAYEPEEKLALVEAARGTTAELLTVWPGKTRSDVFFMDDLDEAESVLRAAA